MYLRIICLLLLVNLPSVNGQDTIHNEKIFPQEGVYFSFAAFRNLKPDIRKHQIYKYGADSTYSIRRWVAGENPYYISESGIKTKLPLDSVWGFAEKNNAFIFLGGKFHKITTLGSISYFLESYPVIKAGMAPVVTDSRGTSTYRLLDFEDGSLYDYEMESFEYLLGKDEELLKEFRSLNNPKTKRKKMYIFLEKYNRKHPVEGMIEE